jgi:hypothetical protein
VDSEISVGTFAGVSEYQSLRSARSAIKGGKAPAGLRIEPVIAGDFAHANDCVHFCFLKFFLAKKFRSAGSVFFRSHGRSVEKGV